MAQSTNSQISETRNPGFGPKSQISETRNPGFGPKSQIFETRNPGFGPKSQILKTRNPEREPKRGFRPMSGETERLGGGGGETGAGGAGGDRTPTPRSSLAERLRRHVARLEGVRHPGAAPERHRAARDYIAAELAALGLGVDLVPFSFRRHTYHNVVGIVSGRDPKRPHLLVGAHFDSTAHTPGADDNASGVAALLECARLVAAHEPATAVEFVGLDLEELQTITGRYRVGSRALARAKRATGQRLAGALILEMVGYSDPAPGAQTVPPLLGIDVPRTGDFLAAVGDARSGELLAGFVAAARATVPELPVVAYRTRLRGWLQPLTRLSDNASFWDARYPSLMLTDTAFLRNPHYHQASDTSATLDYAFLAMVTEATAWAVVRLADAA
jgi:Peptidase family M28